MVFSTGRSTDDEVAGEYIFNQFFVVVIIFYSLDFCSSNDERIKSYLMYQDWHDDLQEANENRWIVDQNKFEINCIVREYEIQRNEKFFFSFCFS